MKNKLLSFKILINFVAAFRKKCSSCENGLFTFKVIRRIIGDKHHLTVYLTFLCFLILSHIQVNAQELATFQIITEKDMLDAPVSLPLDRINYNTDNKQLVLYEITQNGEKPVPCQLETAYTAKLWFLLTGSSPANKIRTFVLKAESEEIKTSGTTNINKNQQDLSLTVGGKPVLSYRFATTLPPEGINPLFKRSGYIHPLWSPEGEILTRIQPPDHYHHYGIWGPWTKTHVGDREVDFWNLAKGEGTVQFAGFLSKESGSVFTGFKALQQHIDFGAIGPDQTAMNEILGIRVWNVGKNVRVIDYTTSLNSPLENGIMLNAYRYGGGIGFRATEKWHKDNCTVLTSDGNDRAEADGSNARWCIVEGESDTEAGRSGILFLSHPSNRMHPEPMRIWPLDANGGRGDMFFEFCPIRHKDWPLEPNKSYTLKYRMVVFDGELDAETAEMYWNSFAKMPQIETKK